MKIDIWFGDGRCSRCYAPSFDRNLVIAKEDEQVWAEYLTKKIGEMLTPDAVDTPEFKMAEEKVRKDRERALSYELRREKEREENPPQLLSFSYTDIITKDIRMKLC